jgi:hypothetical protein
VIIEMLVDGAHNDVSYLASPFGLEFAAFQYLHHQAVVVAHLSTPNNKQQTTNHISVKEAALGERRSRRRGGG